MKEEEYKLCARITIRYFHIETGQVTRLPSLQLAKVPSSKLLYSIVNLGQFSCLDVGHNGISTSG